MNSKAYKATMREQSRINGDPTVLLAYLEGQLEQQGAAIAAITEQLESLRNSYQAIQLAIGQYRVAALQQAVRAQEGAQR